MLADLDETLRALLREDLERHGFEGVEIAFDAPSREWSGQLSKPAVNVFLYDLRESEGLRSSDWLRARRNGRTYESRPPIVMECSYAVTAWTHAVEDEHRLLSQVLAILFAYSELPQDKLNGRLANGSQPWPIKGRIGQSKGGDKADFWSAVGGQYKVSLDYVVQLALVSGAALERGPDVRTQTVTMGEPDTVMYRANGSVKDGQGAPLEDVRVGVPELGRSARTRADGRFVLDRLPPGRHRVVAELDDGTDVAGFLEVPGSGLDLVAGDGDRKSTRLNS